jgi:predicted transcriptional regulator
MSKGRNSTVVGVRLPDELVDEIKFLARKRRRTVSELLRPVIRKYVKRESARRRDREWLGDGSRAKLGLPGSVASPVVGAADSSSVGIPGSVSSRVVKAVDFSSVGITGSVSSPVVGAVDFSSAGIRGHHPCPCGSGKKYRDCCRPKL